MSLLCDVRSTGQGELSHTEVPMQYSKYFRFASLAGGLERRHYGPI